VSYGAAGLGLSCIIASGLAVSSIIAVGAGLSSIIPVGLGLSCIIAVGLAVSSIIAVGLGLSCIIAVGLALDPGCVHAARPNARVMAPIATNAGALPGDLFTSSSWFECNRLHDPPSV
jgi:hypothetical protein